MARIKGKDIYLNNDDQIYFGDNQEGALWYDNGELQLNHTISGTAATESYHLIQKQQLDDALANYNSAYPRRYIASDLHILVNDWGQYVIHHGKLEVAGTLELGDGGMLIIRET